MFDQNSRKNSMNSYIHRKSCKTHKNGRKRDSLADAIKSCVPSLTADVTMDEIEDKALENGCITEDDRRLIYKSDERKRQVRSVVLIITKRNNETMTSFLDALNAAYPYLSEQIWRHYTKNLKLGPKHITKRRCPICQLKYSVDVETTIDRLFSKDIITEQLYGIINSSSKYVGEQDELWEAVLKSCFQNNGVKILLELLDETGHYTHITNRLRKCFKNNSPMQSFCTCSIPYKNMLFSNDSNISNITRASSDSMNSSDLDLASESDKSRKSSVLSHVQADRKSFTELTTGTNINYHPLIPTQEYQKSKANDDENSQRKDLTPDSSFIEVRQDSIQNQTTDETKQQYVRMLSSTMPAKRSKRFKSIVNSAIVKMRVVKRFIKKDHSAGLCMNNQSDIVCETEL